MRTKIFKESASKLGKTAIIAVAAMFIASGLNSGTYSGAEQRAVDENLLSVEIEMVFVQGNGTINDFNIGKFEVTQGQWRAVMGRNPSANQSGDNYPVEQVNWNEARDFITRLNALTGKNYRLPTQREWEYAARGGNKSQNFAFSGSNNVNDVAWYNDNSNRRTNPVGSKQPNELGIHDMSGNVWEWCEDSSAGSMRAIRGGGWETPALGCDPKEENFNTMLENNPAIGFRLAHP